MTTPATFAPEQLLAHVEWVKRLAATLVADRADADDVAQQTLLLAIERPPAHPGNLRRWLSVAARNVARSLGRATLRRCEREARSDAVRSELPAAALVERAELHRVVVGATLALAEPYRSTLLYRFFGGIETSAIAARCGVPVETVRTRLKRGLAQLRERLAHELRDGPTPWRQALAALAAGTTPLVEAAAAAAAATSVAASSGAPVASSAGAMVGGILMSQGLKLTAAAVLAGVAVVAAMVWSVDRRHRPLRPPPAESTARPSADSDPAAHVDDAEPTRSSESLARATDAATTPGGETGTADAPDPVDSAAPARIVGDVRDELGLPVAGAIVVLRASERSTERSLEGLLRRGQFLRGRAPAAATGQDVVKTDELGRFEIDGVSSFSSYGLLAQHPDVGIAFRGDLVPKPGELVEIRLVLPAGVALVGSVLRSDGQAGDDIEVHVSVFPDHVPLEPGKGFLLGKLDADEDGTFRTIALPYRRFELRAEVDRHASELAEARSGIVEADPGARELHVDLTLPEARVIRGRIAVVGGTTEDLKQLEESARARWESDDGDGIVHVSSGSRSFSSSIRALASDRPLRDEVGAAGSRTVRGSVDFEAATYEVVLSEPGMTSVALVLDERVLAEAALAEHGELGPDLVVDLDALPPVEPTTRVAVSVVDSESGRPIGDVWVSVFRGGPSRREGDPFDQFHVPPSGGTVAALALGRCVLVGMKEGFLSERRSVEIRPRDASLMLRMSRGAGTLRGEVRDEHGEPLARASLAVHRIDGDLAVRLDVATTTREDGRFEGLVIPQGRFAVVASLEGRAPAWRILDEDDAREPVLLEAPSSFGVRLVATSATGQALGRIRWRALTREGVPLLEIEVPEADRISSVRLPAGDLTIEAESHDGSRAAQGLTVSRDTDVRLTVAPPPH